MPARRHITHSLPMGALSELPRITKVPAGREGPFVEVVPCREGMTAGLNRAAVLAGQNRAAVFAGLNRAAVFAGQNLSCGHCTLAPCGLTGGCTSATENV